MFTLIQLPEQVWGSFELPISTIGEHLFSSSKMKHSDESGDEQGLDSIAENASFRCWLSWNCIPQIFFTWWLFFPSVAPLTTGGWMRCFSFRLAALAGDFSMQRLLLPCTATSLMWFLHVGCEGLELWNMELCCPVILLSLLPKAVTKCQSLRFYDFKRFPANINVPVIIIQSIGIQSWEMEVHW